MEPFLRWILLLFCISLLACSCHHILPQRCNTTLVRARKQPWPLSQVSLSSAVSLSCSAPLCHSPTFLFLSLRKHPTKKCFLFGNAWISSPRMSTMTLCVFDGLKYVPRRQHKKMMLLHWQAIPGVQVASAEHCPIKFDWHWCEVSYTRIHLCSEPHTCVPIDPQLKSCPPSSGRLLEASILILVWKFLPYSLWPDAPNPFVSTL